MERYTWLLFNIHFCTWHSTENMRYNLSEVFCTGKEKEGRGKINMPHSRYYTAHTHTYVCI